MNYSACLSDKHFIVTFVPCVLEKIMFFLYSYPEKQAKREVVERKYPLIIAK
jgi:hypothetical protein